MLSQREIAYPFLVLVVLVVRVWTLQSENGSSNDSGGGEHIQLSPHVLESYLSKLNLDPNTRLNVLEHINEQFENIYNLEAATTASERIQKSTNIKRKSKMFRNQYRPRHRFKPKSCN